MSFLFSSFSKGKAGKAGAKGGRGIIGDIGAEGQKGAQGERGMYTQKHTYKRSDIEPYRMQYEKKKKHSGFQTVLYSENLPQTFELIDSYLHSPYRKNLW